MACRYHQALGNSISPLVDLRHTKIYLYILSLQSQEFYTLVCMNFEMRYANENNMKMRQVGALYFRRK